MVDKKDSERDKLEKNILAHTLSKEDTLKQLNSTPKGLSSHQAEERLHQYGLNELKAEKGISPWQIIFEQFSSPLVWILLAALIISIVLKEEVDAIIIALIIILNAILGFIQEYRAEKAIEALQKMSALKARVLRNIKEIKIDSKYLVPGDILILDSGNKIAADGRLLEVHTLHTEEGPLTGESQPVTKKLGILDEKIALADRKNMVYGSTIVSQGKGKAVVTATGMRTEVGKIAKMIKEAQQKQTPLQKKLRDLGKYLTIAVVAVAVIVFLVGILSGEAASIMFLTAIALAVAAIPEGLPAVITISLAVGVQKMVKRNALVRKLPSVETLGSVNVICTDKTGTLTHNQMTITKIWANNQVYGVTGSGYEPKGAFQQGKKLANPLPLYQLLKCGALCNDASLEKKKAKWEVIGDPTEASLIVSAEKAGFTLKELHDEEPRFDEIPFSSERKMMTTLHRVGKRLKNSKENNSITSFTKGSPALVLEKCNRILIDGKVFRLDRNKKKQILQQNESFAKQALRVLGFAYKDNAIKTNAESEMIFIGLQAMIDPPREEVKESIKECQMAGIRVIMITGDQINTAQAIASRLGITGKAITGLDLDTLNLNKEIKDINIFARVNPEHKLDIVKALKAKGYVVAMTGDGVNDAPALKKSDIGISMGITGTDVAKEASDMILTDDNFSSIVNAVEEGRGIFDNIRKFVNYLLSANLGEIAVILFATLLRLPLPLTAIQILWVNLVTDGLPATALSVDPHSKKVMREKPRPPKESILPKSLRWDIIMFGVLMGLGGVILFWLYQGSSLDKARTIVFTSLVLFELVRLQTIRRDYNLTFFSNRWLLSAVVLSLLLHLAVIYTPLSQWFKTAPLGFIDWGVLILASLMLWGVYRSGFWIFKKKFGKKFVF